MTLLEPIRGPRDLKALTRPEPGRLTAEIRQFPIHAVARTGGHLGPNPGVVELTIALHRVFAAPTVVTSPRSRRPRRSGRRDGSAGRTSCTGTRPPLAARHRMVAVVTDNSRGGAQDRPATGPGKED
ncbi:hypothetical protein J7E88_04175 [Streptomyces sp. ISL-10]|nr:hypothetical protein [Streptomyces sp. ISL-10]